MLLQLRRELNLQPTNRLLPLLTLIKAKLEKPFTATPHKRRALVRQVNELVKGKPMHKVVAQDDTVSSLGLTNTKLRARVV